MNLHYTRQGQGKPLLLVHGLGANSTSWATILGPLATQRDVIAVDLPGFGLSPPLGTKPSIAALCDSVQDFITEIGLPDISMVGTSMGARIVLELARRQVGGDVVSLNPGGFWGKTDLAYFGTTLKLSIRLIRAVRPILRPLTRNVATRSALLAQLSAKPWRIAPEVALHELRSYADAPSFDSALDALITGPTQSGAETTPGAVTIGWGSKDKVLFPRQARRALELFPKARLVWFEQSGHFPQWDQPEATIRLVLDHT